MAEAMTNRMRRRRTSPDARGGTGKLAYPWDARRPLCASARALAGRTSDDPRSLKAAAWNDAARNDAARRRRAFTLVELITVIAIIGILLAVVLPGASRMWSQRNEAGSVNLLRGLLLSIRTQAIRNGERGLFFWSDEEGHQHVIFIERETPDYSEDGPGTDICFSSGQSGCCDENPSTSCCDPNDTACVPINRRITQPDAFNRFRVIPGKVYLLPAPYRVAPRWAVETTGNPPQTAWPAPLQVKSFYSGSNPSSNAPRYHRNFFAVIFNEAGEFVVGRPVLIHDRDENGDNRGDITGLTVDDVARYWVRSGSGSASGVDINATSSGDRLADMVCLDDLDIAVNFVSVDGLVVYDESSLEGVTNGYEIGDLIRANGQPLYVSRYTGDVIVGPRGQ